jgi:hypothetical protein
MLAVYAGRNEIKNINVEERHKHISCLQKAKRVSKHALLGAAYGPVAVPVGLFTMVITMLAHPR